MNIRKGLVLDFLFNVKAKAFETIMKKHREEREAFSCKFLRENSDSALAKALTELDEMVPKFEKNLEIALSFFGSHEYRFYRSNFPSRGFVEVFFSYPVENNSESVEMFSRQEVEVKELRDAYSNIEYALKGFQKGKPAMEYLRSLGFDVSWVEKKAKTENEAVAKDPLPVVNTDLLFPCKKTGLD